MVVDFQVHDFRVLKIHEEYICTGKSIKLRRTMERQFRNYPKVSLIQMDSSHIQPLKTLKTLFWPRPNAYIL